MSEESGIAIGELRVDGGPTKNKYLMQFQSDIADVSVQVPSAEELSGIVQLMRPACWQESTTVKNVLDREAVQILSEDGAS